MRVLELTPLAKARVWLGGSVATFGPEESLTREVEVDRKASVSLPHLTLEAFVPRGARAEYGMLGVIFQPTGDNVVRVRVPYSELAGDRWRTSLAAAADDVRLGLRSEYANAVLDAAADFSARRFPPGSISVVEAAHGSVGSSADFFRRLTVSVLELMTYEGHRDDEEMTTFLREQLVSKRNAELTPKR